MAGMTSRNFEGRPKDTRGVVAIRTFGCTVYTTATYLYIYIYSMAVTVERPPFDLFSSPY